MKDLISKIKLKMMFKLPYYRKMDDEKYLKKLYKVIFNKELDLANPQTFNEKLQWLKLHNQKNVYTAMVDKYDAKEYVSNIIGEEYIIKTLGIYEEFEEINFDKLPNSFVIKCTHDSGGLVIVKDKFKLDKESAKAKIKKCMNNNFYYLWREWPYKNVKPRIIIEELMTDESGYELKDYKFFVFNGKVEYIQVDFNRFTKHTKNIYNRDWEFMDCEINYPNDKNHIINKPEKLDKMIEIAERLAADIPFLRVDLYSIKNKIYFGELTFFPGSGFMPFKPDEYEKKFGDLIKLPNNIIEEKNEK